MRANTHPCRTRPAVRSPPAPPVPAAREATPTHGKPTHGTPTHGVLTHATWQFDSTDRVSTKCRPRCRRRRCYRALTLAALSTNEFQQIAPAQLYARPALVFDGRWGERFDD